MRKSFSIWHCRWPGFHFLGPACFNLHARARATEISNGLAAVSVTSTSSWACSALDRLAVQNLMAASLPQTGDGLARCMPTYRCLCTGGQGFCRGICRVTLKGDSALACRSSWVHAHPVRGLSACTKDLKELGLLVPQRLAF